MSIEITPRDVARDGMACIIDRWDGEERQTGLDAEPDQRTALADSLIDYLISTGWVRAGDDQQAERNADAEESQESITDRIDEILEGVEDDECSDKNADRVMGFDEGVVEGQRLAKLEAAQRARDADLDDAETGAIIERLDND